MDVICNYGLLAIPRTQKEGQETYHFGTKKENCTIKAHRLDNTAAQLVMQP